MLKEHQQAQQQQQKGGPDGGARPRPTPPRRRPRRRRTMRWPRSGSTRPSATSPTPIRCSTTCLCRPIRRPIRAPGAARGPGRQRTGRTYVLHAKAQVDEARANDSRHSAVQRINDMMIARHNAGAAGAGGGAMNEMVERVARAIWRESAFGAMGRLGRHRSLMPFGALSVRWRRPGRRSTRCANRSMARAGGDTWSGQLDAFLKGATRRRGIAGARTGGPTRGAQDAARGRTGQGHVTGQGQAAGRSRR